MRYEFSLFAFNPSCKPSVTTLSPANASVPICLLWTVIFLTSVASGLLPGRPWVPAVKLIVNDPYPPLFETFVISANRTEFPVAPAKILDVYSPWYWTRATDEVPSRLREPEFEYALIRKSLFKQESGICEIEISVSENTLSVLLKEEKGVIVNESDPVQAVVAATPWPNSTGVPEFKLILAAKVDPSAITLASPPIAIKTLSVFFSPPPLGFGLEN